MNVFNFLTYYQPESEILVINVDTFNREKIILLEILNQYYKQKFCFITFSPKRGRIWKFLKSVNPIELEIIINDKIIDYSNIKDDKIIKNIEKYPIYSSLISLNLNKKEILITFYGNRFVFHDKFDFEKFKLLIKKLAVIFEENEVLNF